MDDPRSELLHGFRLHPGSLNPTVPKEVFARAGGWRRHKREAPVAETRQPLEVETRRAESEDKKEKAKLFNLRWDRERGVLGKTVAAMADAELPPSSNHLTRVMFTLFAVGAHGKRERVAEKEAHLKDGTARAEFRLPAPESHAASQGTSHAPREFLFTAKHARAKTAESGPLMAEPGNHKAAPLIFYSPSRAKYLVLKTEEEIRHWMDEAKRMGELLGATAKAWEIEAAGPRRKELDRIAKVGDKLFGPKGTNARANVLVEELFQLTPFNKTDRGGKGWIYVRTPEDHPDSSKGHWRAQTDEELRNELDKLVSIKRNEVPWLKPKVRLTFFKQEPKHGEAWAWKGVDNRDRSAGSFDYSAQAALMRWTTGFDGVEATFDPNKKKITVTASAQSTFAIAEGEMSGTWAWPDRDGLDILRFLPVAVHRVPGMECRLRTIVKTSASAFAGVSIRGALTFPAIDWKDGWKTSAKAEGNVFAGVQASVGIKVALEWAEAGSKPFAALASISGEWGATLGFSAQGVFAVEYENGRFKFNMAGGLALGLGARENFSIDVAAGEAWNLLSHLFHCIDHHRLDALVQKGYDAFVRESKIIWHTGKALAAEVRDEGNFAKACVRESSGLRKLIGGTPPPALADSLRTLMEEPEEEDFRAILLILNGCGPHQLRWTLRNLSDTPIPGREKEALDEGRKKLFDFGRDEKHMKNSREVYIDRLTALFAEKGI